MKKILLLMTVLAAALSCVAQQKTTTSRLSVWQRDPLIKNGINYYEKLFNTFKYEGNPAAEQWHTIGRDSYEEKLFGLNDRYQSQVNRMAQQGDTTMQKKLEQEREALEEEVENLIDHYDEIYPCLSLLFLRSPSFGVPSALAFDNNNANAEDELIAMSSKESIWYYINEQPILKTVRMKVDHELFRSILQLTRYAAYTSINQDSQSFVLDGTSRYLFWDSMVSQFTYDADDTQKQLSQTFDNILSAVSSQDSDKLKSLAPTIDRLLTHYRSLQLPDQYINSYR
jgi:hypothetical protein